MLNVHLLSRLWAKWGHQKVHFNGGNFNVECRLHWKIEFPIAGCPTLRNPYQGTDQALPNKVWGNGVNGALLRREGGIAVGEGGKKEWVFGQVFGLPLLFSKGRLSSSQYPANLRDHFSHCQTISNFEFRKNIYRKCILTIKANIPKTKASKELK